MSAADRAAARGAGRHARGLRPRDRLAAWPQPRRAGQAAMPAASDEPRRAPSWCATTGPNTRSRSSSTSQRRLSTSQLNVAGQRRASPAIVQRRRLAGERAREQRSRVGGARACTDRSAGARRRGRTTPSRPAGVTRNFNVGGGGQQRRPPAATPARSRRPWCGTQPRHRHRLGANTWLTHQHQALDTDGNEQCLQGCAAWPADCRSGPAAPTPIRSRPCLGILLDRRHRLHRLSHVACSAGGRPRRGGRRQLRQQLAAACSSGWPSCRGEPPCSNNVDVCDAAALRRSVFERHRHRCAWCTSQRTRRCGGVGAKAARVLPQQPGRPDHCGRSDASPQGVGALVFSSSATVYGSPQRLPITEDAPLSRDQPVRHTPS